MSWHLLRRRVADDPAGSMAALAALLAPAGWVYGTLMAARAVLYRRGGFDSYRAPVPVISIGNLAVGGTGKTPTVDLVVKFILSLGKKVAVVSRGYGGRGVSGGVGVVSRGAGPLLTPKICGDEPYLLARRNPAALVVVAPQRRHGISQAIDLGAQVIVLDDGFQHLAVARDLDIVLLDGQRPFGNGHVLPAGILRERPGALARGDLFILTRCGDENRPLPALPGPVLRSRHRLATEALDAAGAAVPLAALAGRRGVAFAGIAVPEAFFADLRRQGLHLVQTLPFPDHAGYGEKERARLERAATAADYLITTEKDGVKLDFAARLPVPCYQVPMRLEIEQEKKLEEMIRNTIEGDMP